MIINYNEKLSSKAVFKCSEDFKQSFKNSTCLLTISVGQEVHENEKMRLTASLVNQSFKNCVILVDDTLQRHSMALGTNLLGKDFYHESLIEGDNWLKRNKNILNQITIPHEAIRWNKWLHHSQYQKQHEQIKSLYKRNILFKSSVDDTIFDYLERYKNRTSKAYDQQISFELCFEYLMEECTALCLWVEGNYHFEVYPSKRNPAMTFIHEHLIKPKHPNLLHPVAIKFKNRKQLQPQSFALME